MIILKSSVYVLVKVFFCIKARQVIVSGPVHLTFDLALIIGNITYAQIGTHNLSLFINSGTHCKMRVLFVIARTQSDSLKPSAAFEIEFITKQILEIIFYVIVIILGYADELSPGFVCPNAFAVLVEEEKCIRHV